jgi:predicted esterase
MPSVPEIRNVAVSNRKSGRLVMKRSLGVVALLAFPLLVQAQAGSSRKVDGFSNTFVLGQPSGYNAAKKWPLLILLHGSGDRAENMFPMWRTAELTKNVIVCALNSRNPQGWDGEDEKAILALLPQLSKEFSVDPAQIWLGGFSAGGFMTAAVEIQHHKLFAGAIIMGSGDPYARQFKEEYKAAALTDHFYLFVGEKDPNNPVMKQTDKNLDAAGCKHKKFVEAAGIGHTYRPQDVQEISKWLMGAIQEVAVSSELGKKDLKKRLEEADRSVSKQDYGKAATAFQGVIETAGVDSEFGKKATKALADLSKKAEEMIKKAKEQSDPAERAKLVAFLLEKFEGTDWAKRAEELKN